MDEQAIRELEISAARVMGWHTIGVPVEVSHAKIEGVEDWQARSYAYHSDSPNATMYYLLRQEQQSYGRGNGCETDEQEVWHTHCPRFARDPAAILESLTWLLSHDGMVTRKTELAEQPFYAYADAANDKGRYVDAARAFGETIGIAVCKAIIQLKATDRPQTKV